MKSFSWRLECVLFLIFLLVPVPVTSFGVDVLSPNFAICLYNARYFDFILEIDNLHFPYWRQHIAGALHVTSMQAVIPILQDCKDRRMLVVSPEGIRANMKSRR